MLSTGETVSKLKFEGSSENKMFGNLATALVARAPSLPLTTTTNGPEVGHGRIWSRRALQYSSPPPSPPLSPPPPGYVDTMLALNDSLSASIPRIVLAPGDYLLSQTLTISRNVTIEAEAPGTAVLDGGGAMRVFDVITGGSLGLVGLNITGGVVEGSSWSDVRSSPLLAQLWHPSSP